MTDRRRPRTTHRVDASMSLLNDVMYRPVDAGYGLPRPPGPTTPAGRAVRVAGHLVLAAALGLVTTTAVVQLRVPTGSVGGARTLLQEKIAERTAQAEDLRSSTDALAAEVAAQQEDALAALDPGLLAELQRVEAVSGAAPVRGPGLVLEITDAPQDDPGDADPRTRVQDVDLKIVTNALWASGAEAVEVNGQRLTALTPIRGVGPAILVDIVALTSPYRIEAIGDTQALQTAFARTTAAAHLATLSGSYGITTEVRGERELELTGAGPVTLRFAEPFEQDVGRSAGSGAPDEPGVSSSDVNITGGTP